MKDGNVTTGAAGPSETDLSLILRVRSNDQDAWRRIVSIYSPVVYGWCRRFGLKPEDAADLMQQVFQAVARGIAGFRRDRDGDTFGGWLMTITRNRIHDHWRATGRRFEAVGGDTAFQQLSQLPDEGGVSSESSTGTDRGGLVLRRALDLIRSEFEDRSWKAFWRTTVDGHDPSQVASDLEISRNAVYIARSRVAQRLRQELDGLIR